jgi:hypothetical protein
MNGPILCKNSLYFNANVSVVLWRGSFVDFMMCFWVHSGSGLTVQLGRAWCTLPVSGWVWRRSETASEVLIQSPVANKKQRWPPVFASNIKIISKSSYIMVVTLCWIVFHGGLCSMHKFAKRVNIGRNSETENPIGPHCIAPSRK